MIRITRSMQVIIIVAASENNVIGKDGGLPWKLPDDLKRFREKTEGHPVIMGRKTFESLPNGPLINRENIVVTHRSDYKAAGCEIASSLPEAIMFAKRGGAGTVFIIGGGEIYREARESANVIELTRVHALIEGDVYFPKIDETVWERTASEEHPIDERHAHSFTYETYRRRSQLHFGD